MKIYRKNIQQLATQLQISNEIKRRKKNKFEKIKTTSALLRKTHTHTKKIIKQQ